MKLSNPTLVDKVSALGIALVLACLPGCLVIPTPEHGAEKGTRANFGNAQRAQIEPGKTTRQEIFLALGEPDAVSRDGRKIAYWSSKVAAYVFFSAGYSAEGGPVLRDRITLIEFNERGVVVAPPETQSWMLSELPTPAELFGEEPDSAVRERELTSGSTVLLRAEGVWQPYVDGFGLSTNSLFAQMGRRSPPLDVRGRFTLTESMLWFVVKGPGVSLGDLSLRWDDLAEVRVSRFVTQRLLVVRTRDGQAHSFELQSKGSSTKNPTTAAEKLLKERLTTR